MKLWRDLVESAGLSVSPANALVSCLGISALIGLAIFSFTTIAGLAIAISLLVLGILFELIRSLGVSRKERSSRFGREYLTCFDQALRRDSPSPSSLTILLRIHRMLLRITSLSSPKILIEVSSLKELLADSSRKLDQEAVTIWPWCY